jgi:hypothetical protein
MTRACSHRPEAGNILLYVLLGILLLGGLTVALRNTGNFQDNIDTEDLVLKGTQVQRYGAELESAVRSLIQRGVSESDIRFAHPDAASATYGTITTTPENQVFASEGGLAKYRDPPAGVNDGSKWEFFGTTDVPQVGSDDPELVAVLPNVTEAFCASINAQLGFAAGTQPTDHSGGGSPDCIMGADGDRFTGTFDSSPNTMDDTTFSRLPATQGCVQCATDNSYNYFYVLLAR